jgi:acyl carrier protein
MDTFREIQELVGAILGVPPASIQPDMKASDSGDWDSTRHLLIVMEIEHKFGFKFALEEIASLDSVGKILTAVESKVSR